MRLFRNKIMVRPIKLRTLLVYLIVLTLLVIYFCGFFSEDPINIAKKCVFHNGRNPNGTGKSITFFEDLLTSTLPEIDQGIFFVETKCSADGIADMKPRYACSIETAAKANPNRNIFVVYASPVGLPRHAENWSTTIKWLKTYPNIYFRNVQPNQLCTSTPLEDWIETSELFNSIARYEHTSDIMRALLVYKFGGTYMDMDYMMIRSLDKIPRNWIARQIKDELNGALFDFQHSGIGNIVLNEILSELAENYRPDKWSYNGPGCFQRVMQKICATNNLSTVDRDQCHGAKIYSPKSFYPIFGKEALKFFDPNATKEVFNRTKGIMGFHFWNSYSKDNSVIMGQGDAYDLIARKHCPCTYAAHDQF